MIRIRLFQAHLRGVLLFTSLLLSSCAPNAAQPVTAAASTVARPAATETPMATSIPPTSAATKVPVSDLSGSLKILERTGYDQPDFWTDFKTKYPRVNVNFEISDSDAAVFSMMKAGDQSDIFHLSSGWLKSYVDNGLVQEIDTSKLSNWEKVPDNFKKLGQVNGKQYFLPWEWDDFSVLYRPDMIPGGVDSWSALLDPKLKPHISMLDDGPTAVQVSSYIQGWDETKLTSAQLAQIKKEWIAQKQLQFFYLTSEPMLITGLSNAGGLWVAYGDQIAYVQLKAKGQHVAMATPKEGRISRAGFYAIRTGTANYDLALKFLDEKLSLATGNNLVNELYHGDSNQDVMNAITDPTLTEALGINDPSILQHTNFTPDITTDQRDIWTAMWADVKAAP